MTLRNGDLKDLVYDIFEVDSYKSKMGSDEDIVVLSFSVKDYDAAKDLNEFLEKGYSFILDADYTSGEQTDGTYKVYIELERNDEIPENIMEIVDGVAKLSNIDGFRFRYYKSWKGLDVTLENLKNTIPLRPEDYGTKVNESNIENYKNFFNKSFVESVEMYDDIIRIQKKYSDPLYFKFVDFGDTVKTIESINESFNANDFAEIIFLSKYIGDYNIVKYGNKLTFENKDKTLVVERIIT